MVSNPGTRASVGWRAVSLAIDAAVYMLLLLLLVGLVDWLSSSDIDLFWWTVVAELSLFYWIGLAYRWETPGKWFVGLLVVDSVGRPPTFEQCLKRSFFPGVAWVGAILVWAGSDLIGRPPNFGARLLLGYLMISLYVWVWTAKVDGVDREYSFYSDRLSGTSIVTKPGYLWFLAWLRYVAAIGVSRLNEGISWRLRWMYETLAPLWLDIRRLAAWAIDLFVLWLAYGMLEDANGIFAQPGSWYFIFLLVAAIVLWILPSYGYSPGKAILNVRIVNAHGDPPGLRAGFVRAAIPGTIWIALLLLAPQRSILPGANWTETLLWLALAISLFVALFDVATYLGDPYQRGMRDLVAGTYVVDAKQRFGARGNPRPLPGDAHWRLVSTRPRLPARPKITVDDYVGPQHMGRRIVGFLIDVVLMWYCLGVIGALLPGYEQNDLRMLVEGLALFGYFVGLVALGSTPGSWIAGVRIVSARQGGAPSFARALVRMLPYLPVLILPLFDASWLAYHFEANELVMMAWDLVLLALLLAIVADFFTLFWRGEPMHNLISDTKVELCAPTSRRGALGTWIVEKWRWLNGDEPEKTLSLTRPER